MSFSKEIIHRTNLFAVSLFDVRTTAVAAVVLTATVVVLVVAVAVSLVLCAAALARAISPFEVWIFARALYVVGCLVRRG